MSAPASAYPPGLALIQAGTCPIGAVHPMACWTCQFGHATECHHPMDCETAQCAHLNMPTDEDMADIEIDVAEQERQERIAAGVERACIRCGCSESRACPGGCIWATETLCSRCV